MATVGTTSALCGALGSVTGVTGVTQITNWKINLTFPEIDTTSFESLGWKQRSACLRGATGTFTSIGPVQPPMGALSTVSFITTPSGVTISGNIILHESIADNKVADVVRFNNTFAFTGKITCTELEPDFEED